MLVQLARQPRLPVWLRARQVVRLAQQVVRLARSVVPRAVPLVPLVALRVLRPVALRARPEQRLVPLPVWQVLLSVQLRQWLVVWQPPLAVLLLELLRPRAIPQPAPHSDRNIQTKSKGPSTPLRPFCFSAVLSVQFDSCPVA